MLFIPFKALSLKNTLCLTDGDDVYGRHPHQAQVMAPSIQTLLVNAKKPKLTKCVVSGLRRWTTYTPAKTLRIIALKHDGLEHLPH